MPGLRTEDLNDINKFELDIAHDVLQFMPDERRRQNRQDNLKDYAGYGNHPVLQRGFNGTIASHLESVTGSTDSEQDLAAMVHDFLENGSSGTDCNDNSDSDHGPPKVAKLFETLQPLRSPASSTEKDLLSAILLLLFSIKETQLNCLAVGTECKGGCFRRLLVKSLRMFGYDAAVCKSKWQSSGKAPGGEYEYIDVKSEGCYPTANRLIVDIDFRSQFEIARPTGAYSSALLFLPLIFVGSFEKLEKILQIMADFAKLSLKENAMPLPPWRTFDYMSAKWLSSYERDLSNAPIGAWRRPCNLQTRECSRTKQCLEQLRHLKMTLSAESENHFTLAAVGEKLKGIINKEHWRPVGWITQQTA